MVFGISLIPYDTILRFIYSGIQERNQENAIPLTEGDGAVARRNNNLMCLHCTCKFETITCGHQLKRDNRTDYLSQQYIRSLFSRMRCRPHHHIGPVIAIYYFQSVSFLLDMDQRLQRIILDRYHSSPRQSEAILENFLHF